MQTPPNSDHSVTTRPSVLVVAGSDSSGLAGIQRDNASILAMGCHPLNVISANTAQNQHGVHGIHAVDDAVFTKQLKINLERNIAAIKIGLVISPSQIASLISNIHSTAAKVVFDPVMIASSGETLHSHRNSAEQLQAMRDLLAHCDIVTPNTAEAESLSEHSIVNEDDIPHAAQILLSLGAKCVFLKGGHGPHSPLSAKDYFTDGTHSFWLESPRRHNHNTRGTGCTLASSIASALALGYSVADACVIGKMAINQGLDQAYALHEQAGPAFITHFPTSQKHIPLLYSNQTHAAKKGASPMFCASPPTQRPHGECAPLGLYPVVDSVEWMARLLPIGITTIQLRVKDLLKAQLAEQIAQAVKLAKQWNCRLFVNDYWELAIEFGAYGVHLGQEDLDSADIQAIKAAGLRLGISTHCHYEVARALTFRPSYIACGPVYHTNTKKMPWVPHGPKGLAYWRETLRYPLVAIGGIHLHNIEDIIAQEPDGIAMITAITQAEQPEQTAVKLLQLIS
ncbi:Thiamine-phosphate synthase [Thalassocella blandensis]|nr:Thiamine-phosphate synthase [Thalassocella blandensis]